MALRIMHSLDKGDLTEAKILSELLRIGKKVLIPFGQNFRYDLLIDDGDKFSRVQCKTGKVKEDRIIYSSLSSTYSIKGNIVKHIHTNYIGEIEYFGVYCIELDKSFLIPVEEAGKSGILRLSPPKNNQKNGIIYASKYDLSFYSSVAKR